MNHTLIATIAGLATAVLWGASDWLSAKSTKHLREVEINFGLQVVGTALVFVLWLVTGFSMPDSRQLIILAIGETLVISAYLLFLKALKHGAIGIIAPIGNSYAIFTVGLSVIFLSQRFGLQQLLAMLVIIIGAMVLAYEKNIKQLPLRELHRDTLIAAAASVTWGVAFFTLNIVVDELSWQTVIIVTQVMSLALAALFLIIARGKSSLLAAKTGLSYKPVLAIGVIGTLGATALYLGSDYGGSIVIPAVLSSCGPLVASILGAIFDHEKLGVPKRVGAVIVVAGVIILNVS